MTRVFAAIIGAGVLLAGTGSPDRLHAQATSRSDGNPAAHRRSVKRTLIKAAMVVPGTGVPAYGPADILLEDGLIARIGSSAEGPWPDADAVINASGKYVMPGIVNTHMHWHEE